MRVPSGTSSRHPGAPRGRRHTDRGWPRNSHRSLLLVWAKREVSEEREVKGKEKKCTEKWSRGVSVP